MKNFIILFVFIIQILNAQEFLRNLPNENMLEVITADKFTGMDAVIILKEQSFIIKNSSTQYRGVELRGYNTIQTNILIVKVFNEAAIKRYGSFEYEYRELFGDEISAVSTAKVRVLKPDGSVFVMPEEEVKVIISRENNRGFPTHRKIIFKIPNVNINDVIQLEWSINKPLVSSYAGKFYYNARDLILYSNLYITLPYKFRANYISFPAATIGEPQVEQIAENFGAGKTYFWSVRNCNPIPEEKYSIPFADRSMMTVFYDTEGSYSSWPKIAETYIEDYLEDEESSSWFITNLDLYKSLNENTQDFSNVDSLYAKMRHQFTLSARNSVYTSSESTEKLVEEGKGDATDCAFLMYQILKEKEIPVNAVLIRDKREGAYEEKFPYLGWFDRMALLVKIAGKQKLYDFDRSVSYNYQLAWYLKSIKAVELGEEGVRHFIIDVKNSHHDNQIKEEHFVTVDSSFKIMDSLNIVLKGGPAERLRSELYDLSENEVNEKLSSRFKKYCLKDVSKTAINNFLMKKDLVIDIAGESSENAQLFDDFLTLKISGHHLNDLKETVLTATRYSPIIFNEPFMIHYSWLVDVPETYKVDKSNLKNRSIRGPWDCSSTVSYIIENGKLRIESNIFIPNANIPVKLYNDFISFLDKILVEFNTDIIFKKV